jgi:hypothetical protein
MNNLLNDYNHWYIPHFSMKQRRGSVRKWKKNINRQDEMYMEIFMLEKKGEQSEEKHKSVLQNQLLLLLLAFKSFFAR